MRVELGGGIFAEETEDGRIRLGTIDPPREVVLTRDQLARKLQAACNEVIDQAGG